MANSLNRRQFIGTSVLAALGTTAQANNWVFPHAGQFPSTKAIGNRSLTPYFLGEDLVRLLQLVDMPQDSRDALTINLDYFQLGKAWQIATKELMEVMTGIREIWQDESQKDKAQTQFALCCGQIAHRTFTKTLGHQNENDLPEAAIYQDVYLLKMLQNADPHKRNLDPGAAITEISIENVQEIFHLVQQRNLIRMHTIRPEFSDIDTWLVEFISYYEQMQKDNLTYAAVYCKPDAVKLKSFVYEPGFYRESDRPVQATRNLQLSRMGNIHQQAKGLLDAKPESIYGKALQAGLLQIMACSNYVMESISKKELTRVIS